jgi:hypothetical protein
MTGIASTWRTAGLDMQPKPFERSIAPLPVISTALRTI